jgi:hypothetical protein
MPGQQVNRTLLTSDGERDLNRAHPPKAGQDSDQRLPDCGVRLVEQPIELLAAPADSNVELAS